VLAAPHRLRRAADFPVVVRRGARSGRSTLVLHLLLAEGEAGAHPDPVPFPAATPARVGFVVPKSVGGSVVRHAVSRRLRAQIADRLSVLPAGSRLVVRALPPAADAPSAVLGRDLDAALERVLRRAGGAR
jgi:ribonuclease P protein component